MILILLALSIIFFAFSLRITHYTRYYYDHNLYDENLDKKRYSRGKALRNIGTNIFSAALACLIIFSIAALVVGGTYSEIMIIDDKIEFYTEQNEAIQTDIEIIINNYTAHESNVYTDLANPASALIAYPELNSNTLFTKQIEIYANNMEQLNSLKERKIDFRLLKWWLMF